MSFWSALSERQARSAAWLAFLALLLVSLALHQVKPPGGYLALEFPALHIAGAPEPTSWTPPVREDAFFGLGLDFLYLLLYPCWFSLVCFLAARRRAPDSKLAAIASLTSGWVWLAMPLDAVENTGLYFWLHGHHGSWLALGISVVAGAKWLVVLAAAAVVLVLAADHIRKRWSRVAA